MALRRRAEPGGDESLAFAGPVTLQNCDREPIHTPGAVQAHGVLVSMDAQGQQVLHVSANGGDLWSVPPQPGEDWTQVLARLRPEFAALQGRLAQVPDASTLPLHQVCEVSSLPSGRWVDLIWSAHPHGVMLEVEFRPEQSPQAVAQQVDAIHALAGRLVRAPDLDRMLNTAVQGLRHITGFDRVMAYRFATTTAARWWPKSAAMRWSPSLAACTRRPTSLRRPGVCTSSRCCAASPMCTRPRCRCWPTATPPRWT